MTTETLQYCIDIAKSKSFTKSAEKYHISQQALSQQIKNLEHELGIRIFRRNNRLVELTAEGSVFIENAAAGLRMIDKGTKAAHAFADGKKGFLSIGYNGPSIQQHLGTILSQFSVSNPEIHLELEHDFITNIMSRFKDGEFDLIGVSDFENYDTELYNVYHLNNGVINAVVGKNHPLAKNAFVYPKDLLKETYLCFDAGSSPTVQSKRIDRCKQILGEFPTNIHSVKDTNTIDMLLASGKGYTFMSSDLKGRYRILSLHFLPIYGVDQPYSSYFVTRKGDYNPALDLFIKESKELGIIGNE